MIGNLPQYQSGLKDYYFALDAAMPVLCATDGVLVRCHAAELLPDIINRLPPASLDWTAGKAKAILWVEPQRQDWQEELRSLAGKLIPGGTLAILASRPLARRLPQVKSWMGQPLGFSWTGISNLVGKLPKHGMKLTEQYGVHTLGSIVLNQFSFMANQLSHPALADRLHTAAQLRYACHGMVRSLATTNLLIARKSMP